MMKIKSLGGFAALALVALASCQSTDRTVRLGLTQSEARDPEGNADYADLTRTRGGEIQVSSGNVVALVHVSGTDSEAFGENADLYRVSFGMGAEYGYDIGAVRVIGQAGVMATALEADLRSFERTQSEVGAFIGLGVEAEVADGINLFLIGRPLEPSVNFGGSDLDARTILFGVGFDF